MPAIPGSPSALAAKTARWATTMTRWAIRFSSTGKRAGTNIAKRWQFVGFAGPNGAESRGIVDILAIRRDHRPTSGVLRPGDLFEIVLVQIKGGTAPWPTPQPRPRDLECSRQTSRHENSLTWAVGDRS